MVAESVRARPHPVAAPPVDVAAALALAADPDAVELGQAAGPRAAVGALSAAAHCTWVVVVDALLLIKVQVLAWQCEARGWVHGGMGAETILHDIVDDAVAGRRVVAVKVVVGAHGDGEDGSVCGGGFAFFCVLLSTFARSLYFYFYFFLILTFLVLLLDV